MGHAKYLSVITAVSRPEFLPIIAWSVPIDAEWILVTDGPQKIPRGLRPHLLIEGPIDTAMFLGRKNAIMNLHFPEPSYGRGWPDLHGERHGDSVFMEAFENQFGLARLPAIYGFHNAIDLLKNSEPDLYSDLEAHKFTNDTLTTILNRCMINADVPPWWHKGAAIAPPAPPCRQLGECSPSCEASSP